MVKKGNRLLCFLFAFIIALGFLLPLNKNQNDKAADLDVISSHGIVTLALGNFAKKAKNEDDALKILSSLKNTYGFTNAKKELSFIKAVPASYGTVYFFAQIYLGVTVFGRELKVAVSDNGTVLSISGNYLKNVKARNAVKISAEDAIDNLVKVAQEITCNTEEMIVNLPKTVCNTEEAIVNLPKTVCDTEETKLLNKEEYLVYGCDLEIYSLEHIPVYVYNIVTDISGGTRFFIDAENGSLVNFVQMPEGIDKSNICAADNIKAGFTDNKLRTVGMDNKSRPVGVDFEGGGDGIGTFAADEMESIGMLSTECKTVYQEDYFGNSIEITVEVIQEGGIYKYYLADALRNISVLNNIKDSKGDGKMAGTLISEQTSEENAGNIFSDKVAVSVFNNFVKTWDFYANEENIGVTLYGTDPNNKSDNIRGNAKLNNEREIIALAHYGTEWENASYFPTVPSYPLYDVFGFGDGKKETMFDMGVALDVVGHEYQHAVTGKINNLVYSGESGALNEAYSDVFGMLIQGYDMDDEMFWRMGEDVVAGEGKCIRDSSNPESLGYPSHMSNRYIDVSGKNNNKVVHFNANIITHALYNMYLQANETGFESFTKETIGKLFYVALPLIPADSLFSEFRIFLQQASSLIGLNGEDSERLKEIIGEGFDKVGVFEESENAIIEFELSGFSGNAPTSITVKRGESFTIPESDINKDGEGLLYWVNALETDSKEYKEYFAGHSYLADFNRLTLYPAALQISPEDYITVVYYGTNGEILLSDRVPKAEISQPPSVRMSYVDGLFRYEFIEWQKNESPSGDIAFTVAYKKSLTAAATALIIGIGVITLSNAILLVFIIKRKVSRKTKGQ